VQRGAACRCSDPAAANALAWSQRYPEGLRIPHTRRAPISTPCIKCQDFSTTKAVAANPLRPYMLVNGDQNIKSMVLGV
jgi:hypothetical protein